MTSFHYSKTNKKITQKLGVRITQGVLIPIQVYLLLNQMKMHMYEYTIRSIEIVYYILKQPPTNKETMT